jgi:hypothetical protein
MSAYRAAGVAVAVVAAAFTSACGEVEGPAVTVSLQLTKASDTVDTTDLTGFVVIVGGARSVIGNAGDATTTLELTAAPELATPVVVYGCTTRAGACREADATVLGCVVVDLVPAEETQLVVVPLAAATPVPNACLGVDGAPQAAG